MLDKDRIIKILANNKLNLSAEKYFEKLSLEDLQYISKIYGIELKSRDYLCTELKRILDTRDFNKKEVTEDRTSRLLNTSRIQDYEARRKIRKELYKTKNPREKKFSEQSIENTQKDTENDTKKNTEKNTEKKVKVQPVPEPDENNENFFE